MRRSDRICVASFEPPDAIEHYKAWKQESLDRYGPPDDWHIDIGRHISGRDFVAVWVLEQHAGSPTG
jgi:hypothetical protein